MNFNSSDALMGLVGGGMIGLAAVLLLLLNGQIAGISGMLGSVLSPAPESRRGEKALFLAGLIVTPSLFSLITKPPEIGITSNTALLISGGLLVGFGTRLGNGCTSGHGVCGMSRFSSRSIAATLTFMAVAVVVASMTSGIAP